MASSSMYFEDWYSTLSLVDVDYHCILYSFCLAMIGNPSGYVHQWKWKFRNADKRYEAIDLGLLNKSYLVSRYESGWGENIERILQNIKTRSFVIHIFRSWEKRRKSTKKTKSNQGCQRNTLRMGCVIVN